MIEQFSYKSSMEVPRLEKITLNMGLGEAVGDKKVLENALGDMTKISGQKPVVTVARKSIAGFKIRDNYPIGCKVTLRKARMYEFLDRLVSMAIPRIRDFRGISNRSFDGRGNYSMGVKEQIIFPEIDLDKVSKITGMDITIVTTASFFFFFGPSFFFVVVVVDVFFGRCCQEWFFFLLLLLGCHGLTVVVVVL